MTKEDILHHFQDINFYYGDCMMYADLSGMLDELIAENKGEPEIGHWSRKRKVDAYDIAGVKTWGIKCQCDRCCFTTIVVEDFGYYRYCPNCGARMKGGEE